jgi:D-glycero-D-manno-heptose 1,7-bisphosphate phosphatase
MSEECRINKGDDLRGDAGVFIDRDGTINQAGPGEYITKWAQFKFLDGALDGFTKLAKLPLKIFVVTNQSAVHRDMITVAGLEHIHGMMEYAIVSAGGRVDGLKYCPHTPKEKCTCRKPSTLLFTELAREHAIDLEKSFNIGDHIRDMQPGNELGMTNILVRTGHGRMMETSIASSDIRVDFIVDNLLAAAEVIEVQIQKIE